MAARLKKKVRVNLEPRSAHGRAVNKLLHVSNFMYWIIGICWTYCLSMKISESIFAGPREARNPNLDSDQRIAYYACAPRL